MSVSPSGPHVPTRTRTRNTSLGPRHDLRFTIGTGSGRQGIRTLTPSRAHSLAPRPGQPYPATFRFAMDPPGVEPTGTRLSAWPLCQFAYRAVKLRVWVLIPSRRVYEARPGTGPPANPRTRN